MKYSKIILTFLSVALFVISGCKKGDGYYVSPNDPTNATANTLLTSIQVSTMNMYEGEMARIPGIFLQHSVGWDGQATEPNIYSLSESDFDNQWGQLYQGLQTGKELINRFGTANPHYSGITKVMMAMNWGMLTDFWGDIPFSEALSDVKHPKFDSQEEVLTGIQALLSDAITDLATSADDNVLEPSTDDLIYGGDVDLWTKAAWTLKARYLNRLSNKASYDPAAILDALSKGISSNAENAMSAHGTGSVELNQWYDYTNQRAYIVVAKTLVDSMKLRPSDKRLDSYFGESPVAPGQIVGAPLTATTGDYSYWGDYLAAAGDKSTPLITYMEALFIKAEVLARQSNAGAAAALNDAIKASADLSTGGTYDGASIATYTAGTTNLSRVMYEKWIAMYGQAEVYNDYRKTGFPAITPNPEAVTTNGQIPKRFPVTLAERTANTTAPTPLVEDPVWWAAP